MQALPWEAYYVVAVIATMVVFLVRYEARPDVVFLAGLGAVLVGGVISPQQAFAGFANEAVFTVGALFVVAAGVQRTEALGFLDRFLFARSSNLRRALPQFMLPTAVLSAFLNNTPIVAMFIPRVQAWAEKVGIPSSKLLIPLSFASIAGGTVTLVGTSTNVVVAGLVSDAGLPPLQLFDVTWAGLSVLVVVVLFFALGGHRLLPDYGAERTAPESGLRGSLFELKVADTSRLAGLTIEEAGLRALEEAYVAHVRRDGKMVPITPDEVLQPGDVLTFTGDVTMLEELLRRDGLERPVPAIDTPGDRTLPLYEAVVADSSELVGKTLKEADFRNVYGGVVLAINRRGEQLSSSLGRTPIRAGDLLLIEARNGFDARWNASREEFYLVAARRPEQKKPLSKKAPLAFAVLAAMLVAFASGLVPLATAAFAAALVMIATGCVQVTEARAAVNLQVLVVIGAALGLASAIGVTGLAEAFAVGLVGAVPDGQLFLMLLAVYLVTNFLTEFFTNNAAAALMVPIALATATQAGADHLPFVITVAIAASASFITPIGYQTNLMVMSPGGYRFVDYAKVGLPLGLVVMLAAVTTIYTAFIGW